MASVHTQVLFAVVVLYAALVSQGGAQQSFFYKCPTLKTVPDLDVGKLSKGSWFVVGMSDLEGFTKLNPRCIQTTFGLDLSVTTGFIVPNGTELTLRGQLKRTDVEGAFNITHSNIVTSGELPYKFRAVEYDDFVFVFDCYKYENQRTVSGWLLSRTPELSDQARRKFVELFYSMDLIFPELIFHDVEHGGCEEIRTTSLPAEPTTTIKITAAPITQSTPLNEPSKPTDDHDSTPQTSPQPTIKVVFAGEGQVENLSYIRSLLAAQWGMLVALLLLGMFVVMSALAVYRMLLPFLRAHHRDEGRTLVLSSNESNTKKSGHYNDGLEVDV